MQIRFTPDALKDLEDTKSWLQKRNPEAFRTVSRHLAKTIRQVAQYPHSGRSTLRPDIRELIEPRYGFIIPYTVREQTVFILRVYNARRRPMGQDAFPADTGGT